MALEALEQICAESRCGRAPKTRTLAFALAYLWHNGGGERWRYDGFWKAATGDPQAFTGWSRFNEVTSFLSGIYHAHGMCRTAEIQSRFDSLYNPDNTPGMCNHYRNGVEYLQNWKEYISWNLPPAYIEHDQFAEDVYPKRQGLVIRQSDGEKLAEAMHWGFTWTTKGKRKNTTKKMNTTNIRNLSSPLWRGIINKADNRCLVPFHQFAEPKPNAGREEVWFKVNEAPVSCFAGIWRETDAGNAYAFLTCEPNPLVKPIHPKAMPVILQPDDYEKWLSGDEAEEFQTPFPSQLMSVVV